MCSQACSQGLAEGRKGQLKVWAFICEFELPGLRQQLPRQTSVVAAGFWRGSPAAPALDPELESSNAKACGCFISFRTGDKSDKSSSPKPS